MNELILFSRVHRTHLSMLVRNVKCYLGKNKINCFLGFLFWIRGL